MDIKNFLLTPLANGIIYLPMKCYRLSLSLFAIIINCLDWKRNSSIKLDVKKITTGKGTGSDLNNFNPKLILQKTSAHVGDDNQIEGSTEVESNREAVSVVFRSPTRPNTILSINYPYNENWDDIKKVLQDRPGNFLLHIDSIPYDQEKWKSTSNKYLSSILMNTQSVLFLIIETNDPKNDRKV